MSNHEPQSRARERIGGDEEATAELKLGEFQHVPTLTLSEARLIINAVMEHRRTKDGAEKTLETEYEIPFPFPLSPLILSQIYHNHVSAKEKANPY